MGRRVIQREEESSQRDSYEEIEDEYETQEDWSQVSEEEYEIEEDYEIKILCCERNENRSRIKRGKEIKRSEIKCVKRQGDYLAFRYKSEHNRQIVALRWERLREIVEMEIEQCVQGFESFNYQKICDEYGLVHFIYHEEEYVPIETLASCVSIFQNKKYLQKKKWEENAQKVRRLIELMAESGEAFYKKNIQTDHQIVLLYFAAFKEEIKEALARDIEYKQLSRNRKKEIDETENMRRFREFVYFGIGIQTNKEGIDFAMYKSGKSEQNKEERKKQHERQKNMVCYIQLVRIDVGFSQETFKERSQEMLKKFFEEGTEDQYNRLRKSLELYVSKKKLQELLREAVKIVCERDSEEFYKKFKEVNKSVKEVAKKEQEGSKEEQESKEEQVRDQCILFPQIKYFKKSYINQSSAIEKVMNVQQARYLIDQTPLDHTTTNTTHTEYHILNKRVKNIKKFLKILKNFNNLKDFKEYKNLKIQQIIMFEAMRIKFEKEEREKIEKAHKKEREAHKKELQSKDERIQRLEEQLKKQNKNSSKTQSSNSSKSQGNSRQQDEKVMDEILDYLNEYLKPSQTPGKKGVITRKVKEITKDYSQNRQQGLLEKMLKKQLTIKQQQQLNKWLS